jgi:hypothetical protein
VIVPFGPRAQAYARELAHLDIEAIVADAEHLPQAYIAAVERRAAGRPFYGLILFDESPARFTMLNALAVLDQVAGYDNQAAALDQLARGTMGMPDGSTVADVWRTFQAPVTEVLGEFCALCDALLVRSQTEYVRLSAYCARPRPAEPVLTVPALPPVARRLPGRPSVVIWAPERPSSQVAFVAFALQEFHGDVTCVTADGSGSAHLNARFVTAADPAAGEALATASCIVCVDLGDPGAAVAFAARGYGIVAPMSSGAHEFVSGAIPYDGKTLDGIYAAVTTAIGSPAAVRQLPPNPPPLPRRPAYPIPLPELPIVSVAVITYNRPADLARALACVVAQTYPRIEIVVVNDAGADVSSVVTAVAPPARYLVMPENGGTLKAMLMGFSACTGDYIQMLADDDFLAPDHIEALVTAMLISGTSMAHGNCLIRHQSAISADAYGTIGFNARIFNETATPTMALLATPISGQSILVHRRVFEAVGPYREDCILADQEFQMRALRSFAYVYVDRMTVEWRARGHENLSAKVNSPLEQRRMYEEMHPVPHRPEVERRRADVLARLHDRAKGEFAFRPTIAFPPIP